MRPPRSLFTHLGEAADSPSLPERVKRLINEQEESSEKLIGWVQLALALIFISLYLAAPRPADAPMTMYEPVPIAVGIYTVFTLIRLLLAYRGIMPGWLLVTSILLDMTLLIGLIWSFHYQYDQPASFSLKVPTFIYIFVFISLRALRFDPRFVLTSGVIAAIGWGVLLAVTIRDSGEGAITNNFVTYLTSNSIMIGAEFDKMVSILLTTVILTVAGWRARDTLITAVREQAASKDIRRFLSKGVADAITSAEQVVEAGEAAQRDAAIIMLDIRGFTKFSTTVPPEEVVRMLTSFHARVVPIIEANGGIVDKFLGDGVMATFGAVEASETAAADALRAMEGVMAEAARWAESLGSNGVKTKLDVNGAIAAGPVVFATLGSADRLEYTVIGEAVNLAAKLEKHNKAEGCKALAPVDTYERACAQGFEPGHEIETRPQRSVAGAPEPVDLVVLRA